MCEGPECAARAIDFTLREDESIAVTTSAVGGNIRIIFAVVGLLLFVVPTASAVTAVLEVNESPYFLDNLSRYQGLTVTRSYAPMPVFFEGFKSTPREEIVKYEWDFGDGSDPFFGFNAAHVYDDPGVYTATLTVTDALGNVAIDTIDVEVLPRDGTTYYVDSVNGNDSNSGTSPSEAWRTATHAFLGMNDKRYGPGDSILFRRGQTFEVEVDLVEPGHASTSFGYMFGAFGTGDKPLIQHTGNNSGFLITHFGVGLGHFTMMDLEFNLTSPTGKVGSLFTVLGDAENILFYRVDIRDFSQALMGNGNKLGNASGFFIVECTAVNSTWVQLWGLMSRYALIDSTFDKSKNHIAYLAYVDRGVIHGNTLSRPAFGRTALRVASRTDDFDFATNNVYISDNKLLGWIDPVTGGPQHADGTRYNWELVNLAPNGPWPQRMTDVVFEGNIVTNAETLITISDYDNLIIRNNLFLGKSTAVSPRIKVGKPSFDKKPIRNLKIIGNTFAVEGTNVGVNALIGINEYTGDPFDGVAQHQDIQIANNILYIPSRRSRAIFFEENNPQLLAAVQSDYNLIYTPGLSSQDVIQIGGNFQGGGQVFTLDAWQSATGNDLNSLYADPQLVDLDGPDNIYAGDVIDANLKLDETSPAIDAGGAIAFLPHDFDRLARPQGAGYDIGAYEQATALTVSIVGAGEVFRDPMPPYAPGQVVDLTAAPAPKWAFVGWSGDLASTNPNETITLDTGKDVTATFVQVEFDIAATTFGQGAIDLNPVGPYSLSDLVQVTAVPAPGQVFIRWEGDLSGTNTNESITIDADKSVHAIFSKNSYDVNVTTIGDGTVTPDVEPPWGYLDTVTFTANPGADMIFWGWEEDASGTGPVTFQFTDQDYDLTARFVQNEYVLAHDVDGDGTVNVSPAGPYSFRDTITIEAVPAPGYVFDGWTGTIESEEAVYTFDIEENHNVTATFVPQTFTISTGITGSGNIELSPPPPYILGETVEVTGVPAPGWIFEDWAGDITGATNPQTIQVNGDMSITAQFAEFGVGLTLWSSPGGTVLTDPTPPYQAGDEVTLTANPSPGFRFLGWSGDLAGTSAEEVSLTLNEPAAVGAHFGRDTTQTKQLLVPFFLDNDGVTEPVNSGLRASIVARNGIHEPVTMEVQYHSGGGVDVTPEQSVTELPASWALQWRPVAEHFPTEGAGILVPDTEENTIAGGARIIVDRGGLTGRLLQSRGEVRFGVDFPNGPQSSYVLPGDTESTTLAVPFFLDNDGITTEPDSGTRSFIGVQNLSDSTVTLTIEYRDGMGNSSTPDSNTYELAPRASISWRPLGDESLEGQGRNVPNMVSGSIAGNAFITADGPIAGRLLMLTNGFEGPSSAYLLPNGEGAESIVAPFLLDNDGITEPVNGGTRAFIGVQNVTDRNVTLIINYSNPKNESMTPSNNRYELGPFQSVSWRPFANEPDLEGAGADVPNAVGNVIAGGARITADGGRIVGRVLEMTGGENDWASYLMPGLPDAQSLVVPHFVDDDGVSKVSGAGTMTFIGISNVTPFEQEVTIDYRNAVGEDDSRQVRLFTLAPFQSISWRPVADVPLEGLGATVPNFTGGVTGSVRITSPLAGIVGRVVQYAPQRSDGFRGRNAYLIPAEYDIDTQGIK